MTTDKHGKYKTGREGQRHVGPRHKSRVPGSSADLGIIIREEDATADAALTDVRFDRQTGDFTFTRAPIAGGGSSSFALASIVGGNVPPNAYDPAADPLNDDDTLDEQGYVYDTAYPVSRPLCMSTPLLAEDRVRTLPRVKKWSKFGLPTTYTFGDPLPRMPDGICYLRLERPYTITYNGSTSSWDAYLNGGVITSPVGNAPVVVDARSDKDDRKLVRIYFDRPVNLRSTADRSAYTFVSSAANAQPMSAASLHYSEDLQAVEVTLNREIDPLVESITVTVRERTVLSTTQPPYANVTTSLPVVIVADYYTLVVGLNRNSTQGYNHGDLVVISTTPLLLQDESEAAVRVPVFDILHAAGPSVPLHSHAVPAGGAYGGGSAMLTPTTTQKGTRYGG